MDGLDIPVVVAGSLVAIGAIWLAYDPRTAVVRYANLLAVGLALLLGVGKAISDGREKELLRTALMGTLNLPVTIRAAIGEDVLERAQTHGRYAPREGLYQYTEDGMAFFLHELDTGKDWSFVMDRFEVAEIYANATARYGSVAEGGRTDTTPSDTGKPRLFGLLDKKRMPLPPESYKTIDRAMTREYDLSRIVEDFDFRLVVLGSSILRLLRCEVYDYYYDDDRGVVIRYIMRQQRRETIFSREDIGSLRRGAALELFTRAEQEWRKKIAREIAPHDRCLPQELGAEPEEL